MQSSKIKKAHFYLGGLIIYAAFNSHVQAATFMGLGDLQPGPVTNSSAWGISGNGSTVVGAGTVITPSGPQQNAFLWKAPTGMTQIPLRLATDASADGTVVAGDSVGGASRWTQAGGTVSIGSLGGGASARAISGDGSVIVGFSDTGLTSFDHRQAFRWSESTGMVGLGYLSAINQYSSAWDVSSDGSVIVGVSSDGFGSQAFRWTAGTGMVGLTSGPLDQPFYGTPNGISSDGSTIFGQGPQAWMWKESTGVQYLGTNLSAYGANADGSIIVGGEQFCCSSISFIWDAVNGPRNLKTVLQNEYGLDLTGWTLKAALDISDDGTKIVGVGINPLGYEEAWYADLAPVPLPAPAWLMLSGIGLLFGFIKKPSKVRQA